MGRRGRACYCCCRDADGTVDWISHTVADGVITKVDHNSPCVTYYVESVSGGGAETGTGTADDPWTNLNTVFADTCIKSLCTTTGCPMVKVLVKGTIDYTVNGGSYDFKRKLVLEPWGEDEIIVAVNVINNDAWGVKDCIGIIFKHVDSSGVSTRSYQEPVGYGFSNCYASTFDTCNGTGTGKGGVSTGYNLGYGFAGCYSSTFQDCNGTGDGPLTLSSTGRGYGFVGCYSSTFSACIGTGTGRHNGEGFSNCYSSTFDTCDGIGTSAIANSYGYYSCASSTYHICSGIGTSAGSIGYGFYNCNNSTFDTCDGASTTCGFYGCAAGSSFIDCTATPTGAPCDT